MLEGLILNEGIEVGYTDTPPDQPDLSVRFVYLSYRVRDEGADQAGGQLAVHQQTECCTFETRAFHQAAVHIGPVQGRPWHDQNLSAGECWPSRTRPASLRRQAAARAFWLYVRPCRSSLAVGSRSPAFQHLHRSKQAREHAVLGTATLGSRTIPQGNLCSVYVEPTSSNPMQICTISMSVWSIIAIA